MEDKYQIEVKNLCQYFKINENFTVKAVDDISFGIKEGEVFGLVGETGCGKSTVAKSLCGIYKPTFGQILYENEIVTNKNRNEIQIIFQDSAAALNPRMTVEKIILEPLRIQHKINPFKDNSKIVIELLEKVGLPYTVLKKRPGELSGGQRQRVAIARSLIVKPKFIIADEPIASLDISIQAQIIMLLKELQKEQNFALLFIAHDLSMVRFISNKVGVMFRGKLVEIANTEELFINPCHPYTQSLLSAIHIPDPDFERAKTIKYYDENMKLGSEMKEIKPGHFVLN